MTNLVEENELQNFKSLKFNENAVIFDIGANKGDYTQMIIDNINVENYTIHLFEPVPAFFEVLEERFKGNTNIILNNLALHQSERTLTFNFINAIQDGVRGCSSFINRPVFKTWPVEKIKVKTKRLTSYTKENNIDNIDFIKIDTEGTELNVLRGAYKLLEEHKIKLMQVEYGETYKDANNEMNTLLSLIRMFGYDIYEMIDGKLVKKDFVEDYKFDNYFLTLI